MIHKGRIYTTKNSDICLRILNIPYENDEYYKLKIAIHNKHNGIFYEKKHYKIAKDIPRRYGWYDIGGVLG